MRIYPVGRLSALAAFTLSAGLFAGPVSAVEVEEPRKGQLRLAQAAESAEETRSEQTGSAGDPLDPAPARTRSMNLGGDQAVGAGTGFNPGISVILDGTYYNAFSGHEEGLPGFGGGDDHGHGHGDEGHGHGLSEGFQLRSAELVFTGSVDPYFDMLVQAALFDGGIEIEEAYITTRRLPAGLQFKAGRFLSDVGYINKQHIHSWDFVDQPWMIEHLFGEEGLRENGIQLSWMPATNSYTRFGVELLNGESEGVANYIGDGEYEIVTVVPEDPDSGNNEPVVHHWEGHNEFNESSAPRLATAFAKWAPNLGYTHALQMGLFGGVSEVMQREAIHDQVGFETWDGDASFYGFDAVYKYDGDGNLGHRDFRLQMEYLRREMDLLFREREFTDFETMAVEAEAQQKWIQDGLYVQGVYGVAPRWNMGLRVDALGLTNDAWDEDATVEYEPSWRYALQTTFAPSEFSRLRAQVNYSTYGHEHGAGGGGHEEGFWEFMLQFNISLGVHGAHRF